MDTREVTSSARLVVAPAGLPVDVLSAGVRWSRAVVVVTVVAVLAASALPAGPDDVLVLALVGAGLVAGLPHGAIDHRVAAGLTGWPTVVVAGGYAAVAALTWVLLTVASPVALVAVLVLSVAHFGLGELEVVRETTGWHPSRVVGAAVAVAGTGALLLPLARAGAELGQVAGSISPQLGGLLLHPPLRVAIAVVWVVAAGIAGVAAARSRRYGVLLDVVLVGLLGAVAPPLVAFAIWFGGWHGLRHCARLLGVEPRCAVLVAEGRPGRAVGVLARLAAWPTLAALVVLAGLIVVGASAPDTTTAVGKTLLVLLALTVPHMLVVLWLDRGAHATDPAARRTT
jgi:Brp/Blh family beta-carotene 15,15'-monooxygenase